jgi:hypothetical protein
MLHGYQSYSNVSLEGSYSTSSGGGGGSNGCPAGYTKYNGSLSGRGDYDIQPNGTYYYAGYGAERAILIGPSGADYDLYLGKWNGRRFIDADSSLSAGANERVDYNGSRGYYEWQVYDYRGSGSYTLCISHP